MAWFERLIGHPEGDPEAVRRLLRVDGDRLVCDDNGRSWQCGRLETPSLAELRTQAFKTSAPATVREVVADVQSLHADPASAGAVFQVASQFNLLEMVSPSVTPEQGVSRYESDPTQGPACAIAAGAGTIVRNYFTDVDGHRGQTADRQIDCSADLHAALRGDGPPLWRTRNGYALPDVASLRQAADRIDAAGEAGRDELRGLLRVGVQRDTEVTLPGCGHTVTQVFCSAMPVAYGELPADEWEPLARLVLEAAYEATLLIAANVSSSANDTVRPTFLTMLGGGAFGNRPDWIVDAAARAVRLVGGLDARMVSYGSPSPAVERLVREVGSAPE